MHGIYRFNTLTQIVLCSYIQKKYIFINFYFKKIIDIYNYILNKIIYKILIKA